MITSLLNATSKINIKTNTTLKTPEWKKICKECHSAAKKSGWTKSDSKNLLKQIRENNNF
ncbi:MAG: hypothetical protein GX682_04420 [Clostridiaceae bacterium]|nr:hypothetical protein [Clostridiaceae bacterium]